MNTGNHILYTCPGCERGCMFCDGGLSACTVCHAFEGSWPDNCPGVGMSEEQADAVYAGKLNYRDGKWREECCQVMRPTRDTENFMVEHGYTTDGNGGWTR